MEVRMNGWWHPSTVMVRINLWGITQAEELAGILRKFGSVEEAEELEKHIKDQCEFKCGGHEFYLKPQVPALEQGVFGIRDCEIVRVDGDSKEGGRGRS